MKKLLPLLLLALFLPATAQAGAQADTCRCPKPAITQPVKKKPARRVAPKPTPPPAMMVPCPCPPGRDTTVKIIERVIERPTYQPHSHPLEIHTHPAAIEPVVGAFGLVTESDNLLAPSVGLIVRLTDRWRLHGSAGESWQEEPRGFMAGGLEVGRGPWSLRGSALCAWINDGRHGYNLMRSGGWAVGPVLVLDRGVELHAAGGAQKVIHAGEAEGEWLPAFSAGIGWRPLSKEAK